MTGNARVTSRVADDLSREVYGLLGLPVDKVDMEAVLTRISAAAGSATPFLLSTPNLDFLTITLFDREFRESLLLSDLCPPDGMPIVWISKLLGIPIAKRIAGADIFAALKTARQSQSRLAAFLFGGAQGVAAKASRRINEAAGGVACVGWLDPGFLPVDDLSRAEIIAAINDSHADFLAVGLSARKGLPWLLRNHYRLKIPVRASLGATLNFEAGTLARAPALLRCCGLEWLWRIKEEPRLWTRYWRNLCILFYLLLVHVLPLAIVLRWIRWRQRGCELMIRCRRQADTIVISLAGAAVAQHVDKTEACLRGALAAKRHITVDLSNICAMDPRFIGLLLIVRKHLIQQGLRLTLAGATLGTRMLLRLNAFGFLLAPKYQTER